MPRINIINECTPIKIWKNFCRKAGERRYKMASVNTEHKDRLFRFLFGSHNREWTLELFNAVNGTEYTEPEDILFTTIDDAE